MVSADSFTGRGARHMRLQQGGFDHETIGGFSRTVTEIQWLLLVLVLFYLVVPADISADENAVIAGSVVFAAFVLIFQVLGARGWRGAWKLAVETWAMIVFITWVMWFTGKGASPLFHLYLLAVITSALTLGKVTTLLEVALISVFYVFVQYHGLNSAIQLGAAASDLMLRLSPLWLAAYLTAMLRTDIDSATNKIKELSEIDEMTGLYNMRAFKRRLRDESERAQRYNRKFAIMMVDADNLKGINDKLGHEAGNDLIRLVADSIRDTLRSNDIIARYGGDEFVAMLIEIDARTAGVIGERIRAKVAADKIATETGDVGASVSIGVGAYPEHGGDVDRVMECADKALYVSKQGGRNRVTVFAV